jgi:hypothetical protein
MEREGSPDFGGRFPLPIEKEIPPIVRESSPDFFLNFKGEPSPIEKETSSGNFTPKLREPSLKSSPAI